MSAVAALLPAMTEARPSAARAHAQSVKRVVAAQRTSIGQGLDEDEVQRRLSVHGPNAVRRRRRVSALRILANQFESPVVVLLAVAAIVAFASDHVSEALAIAIVLGLNSVIGFTTEFRAVRSMEALRSLGTPETRVRRAGRVQMVPSAEIVPGDVVLVEGGDVATADLRIAEASGLAVDESALTGESVTVDKHSDAVPEGAPLPERNSMIYKGTAVTRGSAVAIATATGMETELGHIALLVEKAEPESSPLEHQLAQLSGQLLRLTIAIAAAIGAIGVVRGEDPFLMIEAAIALAVAAIPEGLPVVATMALARGMWRMARANALVERLSAVETLGATTVILTDKTGTLTENRMTVREFATDTGMFQPQDTDASALATNRELLNAIVLCNNADLGGGGTGESGDPLELALLRAGRAAGLEKPDLEAQCPRVREVAFSSETKIMATVHAAAEGLLVCVKGAPEEILAKSRHVAGADGRTRFGDNEWARWTTTTGTLAAEGLKVLGVATTTLSAEDGPITENLTFLGLVGMYDPPRADVPDAIRHCREAGVRVIMMTGDHALTARTIAAAIGLTEGAPRVAEGGALDDLGNLPDEEVSSIRRIDVFARVTPRQKLDIIAIHQRAGEVVAMTGDGVNDAPALKKADIGIAMGLRGTQVAREAAAMVLRDDAFGTIVNAIREGRVIFRNIQAFVTYLLSCNLSEVLVVGLAVLTGLPLPLLPLQILFLNLVTDVFPAFALGFGEGEEGLVRRRPRDPAKGLLTRPIWYEIVGHGVNITVATLGAFLAGRVWLELEGDALVTISFLTLAFAQLWHVFNMRDIRSGLVVNGVTRNPVVWGALALCTALLLAVLFTPPAAMLLRLVPPSPEAWAVIVIASFIPLLVGQVGKAIARRR